MNTAASTPAALRHKERIAQAKARLANAQAAQQHAARRRDAEAAAMWREHAASLRAEIARMTTAAL